MAVARAIYRLSLNYTLSSSLRLSLRLSLSAPPPFQLAAPYLPLTLTRTRTPTLTHSHQVRAIDSPGLALDRELALKQAALFRRYNSSAGRDETELAEIPTRRAHLTAEVRLTLTLARDPKRDATTPDGRGISR